MRVRVVPPSFSIPLPLPAQILTKDSVTASVDGVVYFRVSNPTWAKVKVDNYYASTWLIAQTTLRNTIGTKTLSQLLLDREAIADELEVCVPQKTKLRCAVGMVERAAYSMVTVLLQLFQLLCICVCVLCVCAAHACNHPCSSPQRELDIATDPWGIKVLRVEM